MRPLSIEHRRATRRRRPYGELRGGRRTLRAYDSGKTFGAHEVIIREYRRFEGVSDPDDMAIVYAIESLDGTRGLLADAFGVYSNLIVSAFLQDVPIRRTVQPGTAAVHA